MKERSTSSQLSCSHASTRSSPLTVKSILQKIKLRLRDSMILLEAREAVLLLSELLLILPSPPWDTMAGPSAPSLGGTPLAL